jgi:hypothetical protein
LKSDFTHRSYGLWPSGNGDDIREGIQKPLSIDMLFDRRQEMLESNSSQKDDQSDLTRHDPIREIDGLFILIDRKFSHRWTDRRNAPETFDESRKLVATTALEGTDPHAMKVRIA